MLVRRKNANKSNKNSFDNMANNKWRAKEFTPTANQIGMSHSWSAQAVVENVITNKELAKKIEARGMSRAAEIKGILEEAANIIMEEIQENNRVQLEGSDGILASFYPQCSGSISDKDVQDNPSKYPGKTVAEEEMLTADMLTWNVGAQVGRKFSKQFAMNKTAQKVDWNASQTPANPADEQGGSQQGGTTNPPSGGENEDGE